MPLIEIDHTFAEGEIDLEASLALVARLVTTHLDGGAGFLDLPGDQQTAAAVRAFAEAAPPFDDLVVVGIGGSALSARVFAALRPDPEAYPRLHVVDTVDPARIAVLQARLDPARTLVVGISKSGVTLELGAVFPCFTTWMAAALGPEAARPRIACVAGVAPNPLRATAEEAGYACFDIPEDVGGRFSALSPVGLLPAALLGVEIERILAGARAAHATVERANPDENPAAVLALRHAEAEAAGLHTAVIWPYGERLGPLGPWCSQLISESTGQRRSDGSGVGVAAFPARGPADQHSLLQLLLDGPPGRFVVFLESQDADTTGIDAPSPETEVGGVTRSLGEILRAERAATAYALHARGRPYLTIRLRDAGPDAVGALLLIYEAAVAMWGLGLGVDPFGQPAVALGKDAALARLTGTPEETARALDAHAAVHRTLSRIESSDDQSG